MSHFRALPSRPLQICSKMLTHFDFKQFKSDFRHLDSRLINLDDVFIEKSKLEDAMSELQLSECSEYIKRSFWKRLIEISWSHGKQNIVNSLLMFILESPNQHSHHTLLSVLKILAHSGRFSEFKPLYYNFCSGLSPQEAVVFSADIVSCLCLTPLYKESFFYLDLAIKNGMPLGQFLCILVGAAKYAPYVEVFETIDLFHTHGLQPSNDFYLAFVNRVDIDRSVSAMHYMERLLDKLSVHEWIISSSIITGVKRFFERRGWTGTLGVKAMGLTCGNCHYRLAKYRISDDEISSLTEGFYKSVVLGTTSDELYLTTTPEELASLKNFIRDVDRKFDCIIDLPNFFHTALSAKKISSLSEEVLSNALCSALQRLHGEHHLNHFCLVGKQRGIVNNKKFWNAIKQLGNRTGITVRSFVTSHKSNDDAFMIYLALWSGPSCYIISNDEFRQHRFTLGPKLGEQLSKWQAARQITLHPGKPIVLCKPMECAARVQGNASSGWHIPYKSTEKCHSYSSVHAWLCLLPPAPSPRTTSE